MRVTEATRAVLAFRRQRRELERQGYVLLPEPYWEVVRGDRWREQIVDVKISTNGKSLYVKTEAAP